MLDFAAFEEGGFGKPKQDDEIAKAQTKAYRKSTAARQIKVDKPVDWKFVPPEQYFSKYNKIRPIDNELKYAFGDGSNSHNNPLVTRKPVKTITGASSFDEPHLEYQRALVRELNKRFEPKFDERWFTTNGVHATFDRLLCPAGYFSNPMSYTMKDNAVYRESLGLSAGYSPRQREIAKEAWRLVFKELKLSKVKVPKMSTGGMRRFTKDVQWKLAYARWLFEPERFEAMLDAIGSDDWTYLANEFEMVFATYIQKRGQVDMPGKVREVFDLTYAETSGKKGRRFPTDKSVVIDRGGSKQAYPDFSALRARVVHAGPWVINCFLQTVSTCAIKSLFARYPDVFHVNTREEILRVIDGKEIWCSDVTEYDRSMSRDAIRVPHDVAEEFIDPRIVKASWRLFTSPYYSKPLDLDGKKGHWVGNPLITDDEVFAGNRSGHAWTSLVAKVNKVIDTLFIIDHMVPVLGRVERFFLGDTHIGFINNGDDEVIWADTLEDLDEFISHRKDKAKGHYLVEAEMGMGFSGLLIKKIGEREYDPVPKLHTPFEKMWVPERGIDTDHRKFWPIGFFARIDSLTKTDAGAEAWRVSMSLYRDIMGPHYGDLIEVLTTAQLKLGVQTEGWSDKDKAVLESPEKLSYLYDDDEISPAVVDKVTSNIPIEAVERLLSRYYTGLLV